jgi:Uncharacterized protein conserved in bacteria C-term(DUF2220)
LSTALSTALSPTAARLGALLRSLDHRRVGLPELWRCFLDAAPEALTAADKRARLAELLAELEDAALVRLPQSVSAWDRMAAPPLPRSVLVAARAVPPARAPAEHAWLPELAWAASLRLRTAQREQLVAVNDWLRDGGATAPIVPSGERSLGILGDEKALGRLADTGLFGPGRLSWALLRCEPLAPPFVWRAVGDGTVLLVVENHDTFHSLCRWLAETPAARRGVGLIAFGAGDLFVQSVRHAAELGRDVTEIRYFGDLDARGLQIPVRAGPTARAAGLPEVVPCTQLYRLLLERGRPQPGRVVDAAAAADLVAWLPEELRPAVTTLLCSGHRLAQEWVGYETLRGE